MINIMYVTTYGPVRVHMRKCLCFFTFFSLFKHGFQRALGGGKNPGINGQHAYTWANVGVFDRFYMQIRSA